MTPRQRMGTAKRDRERVASRWMVVVGLCLVLFTASPLRAQWQGASNDPFEGVGVDQRMGAQVPLAAMFRDEAGNPVRLGDFIQDKPVVLNLVYFQCPMLCNLTMNNFIRTLRSMPWSVGDEFEVITVSFDPREGPARAASAKRTAVHRYGRPDSADGWHFLTGEEASIERLTEAVGFRYQYDATNGQYAHSSTLIVLTPAGEVARYLPGVEFSARDLRLSLVEASQRKIGSPTDKLMLLCYAYNPATGKYGLVIQAVIRVAGLTTVAAILGGIVVMLRRERHVAHASRVPEPVRVEPDPPDGSSAS